MQTDYEREHGISDTNPMGQPPNISILSVLRSMVGSNRNGIAREDLSLLEDMGLNPNLFDGTNKALKSFNKLPKSITKDFTNSDAQCIICFDTLSQLGAELPETDKDSGSEMRQKDIVKMPCSHQFHYTCLKMWLNQVNTCPSCRHPIKTDSEWENEERKQNMEELFDSMFS